MFGPKKHKVSKSDIKKSIAKANDKLRDANARMESDIKVKNNELKSLLVDCTFHEKSLEDIQGLQAHVNNQLEAQQFAIFNLQNDAKKVSSKITELSKQADVLTENNKKLEAKEKRLIQSVSLLEAKKEKFKNVSSDLKAIKREEEEGQETLSLLAIELNQLETGVEAYLSRKSAAESEFGTFKAKIDRAKRIAEEELREIEDFGKNMKLANGQEMGRLDHAIADRMSELQDLDSLMKNKSYKLSTIQSSISSVEERVNDAEERIDIAIKKEQDKVNKIKGDFKDWKIEVLDGVAKMKIKGKMENIDKAGLKEVLDG
tara:strand:- start:215 stop:1165 length:951 start_codon:yes stop_codon:yes gene_type:complete